MTIYLKDCHISLSVKSKSETNSNLFVSSCSGFVVIGALENLAFSKKSLVIPIKKLKEFKLEVKKLISFLLSNIESNEAQISHFGNYSWSGQTENDIKTVCYYQKELLILKIDVEELFSITYCFSKVVFHSFLFKDLEILFVETIVRDCLNGDLLLKNLEESEDYLAVYITNFVCKNKDGISINTKTILKNIFIHYNEDIQVIFSLATSLAQSTNSM